MTSGELVAGHQRWACTVHGAPTDVDAELVFTTSHSGYVEACTDPSYAGQALVFAHPTVGSRGTDSAAEQSSAFQPALVVARHPSAAFVQWVLQRSGCVASCDSTRELVVAARREQRVVLHGVAAVSRPKSRPAELSCFSRSGSDPSALVVDFGVKRGLLEELRARGVGLTVVEPRSALAALRSERWTGVLLSSGPGDPRVDVLGAQVAAEAVHRLPGRVAGVCYGHQLLCIAAGFSVEKLAVGHRGCNHPVLDCASGVLLVTSHNHGFAVSRASVSRSAISHVSCVDGSVEGVRTPEFTAVQFHPEGCPGPRVPELLDSIAATIRGHS